VKIKAYSQINALAKPTRKAKVMVQDLCNVFALDGEGDGLAGETLVLVAA
jgi:hypothetical protein